MRLKNNIQKKIQLDLCINLQGLYRFILIACVKIQIQIRQNNEKNNIIFNANYSVCKRAKY